MPAVTVPDPALVVLIGAFISPERGAEQGQPPDIMFLVGASSAMRSIVSTMLLI